ncbi:ATP-binding protein [Polaromonas sp.]|uniref:sensor histidine kinase n=1 Tax=Polaromonas sp. TaxID=1869339 RepID=UPI003BB70701
MKSIWESEPPASESEHSERLLLQRAITSSKNGITIGRALNGQFPLIYANPAFYRLTGFAPGEVIGQDCRFLQQGHKEQPGLRTLRCALAQGAEATVLLHSVLQNLLGNALKYSSTTPGARVHFGREPGGVADARFFVRDNGAGFDMKNASRLFDAFQRFHSEDEFPGTGVGLATVHRIVTRHGGVVSAESAPGAGAVFYFSLGTPCVAP